MASLVEVAKVVGTLLEMFPAFKLKLDKEARKEMFKAYHLVLEDLDATELMRVAVHLGSTQTFFPAAGEIRRAYFNLRERAEGVPSGDEAWAEVKGMFWQGFSRANAPSIDDFSHPRIHKALAGIGGWHAFCNSTNDMSDRARFLEAYQTHTQRDREEIRMLPQVRRLVSKMAMDPPALTEPEEESVW